MNDMKIKAMVMMAAFALAAGLGFGCQGESNAASAQKESLKAPDLAKTDSAKKEEGHNHEHDDENPPCASNFVVQPEKYSKVEQGVTEAKAEETPAVKSIVFITTSRACDCTMKRCEKGDKALKAAYSTFQGLPELKTVNYARQPQTAKELATKHKAMMLPIILFLDDKDELLVKIEGEFSEDDVKNTVAKYFAPAD